MIGYRKILMGHFMTFYEILRNPTISFWDAAHLNIHRLRQSGIILGILKIKCAA